MDTIEEIKNLIDHIGQAIDNKHFLLSEKLLVELLAASDRVDTEVALQKYVG